MHSTLKIAHFLSQDSSIRGVNVAILTSNRIDINHFVYIIIRFNCIFLNLFVMKTFNSAAEKEEYYAKRRKRGFVIGGVGAAILGGGFVLQYILYMTGHSFNGVMYSLTTIGICLVMYAAVEIFGW